MHACLTVLSPLRQADRRTGQLSQVERRRKKRNHDAPGLAQMLHHCNHQE